MAITRFKHLTGVPISHRSEATTAASRYIQTAVSVGCPPEQIEIFLRYGIVLQEAQLVASAAARECDVLGGPNKVGFGGARGGGKSFWMLAQMAEDCLRYPGIKCLMLRKVGKSLKENFEELIRNALGTIPYKYVPTRNILLFENGSHIVLGHFQNEKEIDTYLGLGYDVIGIEEATTLTSTKHTAIETCNRTSRPNWRPRMYYTTNPGGVGHGWFKALFIAPFKTGKQTATRFIPSTVDDNRFINVEYKAILDRLPGWQLRAWRYGDWDIAAGQFFSNFRSEIDGKPHHVVPWRPAIQWGLRAFGCSFDYGFTHYTSVHLLGENGDGEVIVLDEYSQRRQLPSQNAIGIHGMLTRNGLRLHHLKFFVAGLDAFSQRGNEDGKTIADEYKLHGITLTPANTERISGAAEILRRFGDVDTTPVIRLSIKITDKCSRLIECIPALQHDPHRPEDVLKWDADENGEGGDDAYDDFRYGVMEFVERRIVGTSLADKARPEYSGYNSAIGEPGGNNNIWRPGM